MIDFTDPAVWGDNKQVVNLKPGQKFVVKA